MKLSANTHLVADAASVLHEQVGTGDANRLLAEAAKRVKRTRPADGVSGLHPTSNPEHLLWSEILRGMAAERPELFGESLADLSERPHPATLAFLLVKERYADQLRPFRGSRAEREGIAQARRALNSIVTDYWEPQNKNRPAPNFEHDPEVWVCSSSCPLLHTYAIAQNWAGLSLFCERPLRHVVVVSAPALRRRRRRGLDAVVEHLLHEGIHGAIADAADSSPTACEPKLTTSINEAITEVLALGALHLLAPDSSNWGAFRDGATREMLGLLSLAPPVRVRDLHRFAELGVANLAAGTHEDSLRLLREFAGDRGAGIDLAYRLDGSSAAFEVHWGDGVRTRHWGIWLDSRGDEPAVLDTRRGRSEWYSYAERHRGGGQPAIVSPETIEHWRYGLRHREPGEGPALVVMPGASVDIRPRAHEKATITVDGPAQLWFDDGRLHRDPAEGPALIAGELAERQELWSRGVQVSTAEVVSEEAA